MPSIYQLFTVLFGHHAQATTTAPGNSYIDVPKSWLRFWVLPITLSLVYMQVALTHRPACDGIGTLAYSCAAAARSAPIYVDPFHQARAGL